MRAQAAIPGPPLTTGAQAPLVIVAEAALRSMPVRVRRGPRPFLPDRLGAVPAVRGHPSPVAPNDPTRCAAPARTLDSAPHGITSCCSTMRSLQANCVPYYA